MNILITGSKGMLGCVMTAKLSIEYQNTGQDIPDIDITDLNGIRRTVFSYKPDLIINAAAYTAVDGCEINAELAFAVNARGPRNLAVVCQEFDIPLVHFSTDYIFDGMSDVPYKEMDRPNPLNVYGKSKLQGENLIREITNKHYIIRTSWLYGEHGKNFVATMLRLAWERDEIGVVNDQTGSPTYIVDLAEAIAQLILIKPAYGTYHITNSGSCTWYQFALEIFRQAGIRGVRVNPITTEEINRPAPRPRYSVLDNSKWHTVGGTPLRHYKEALADYLKLL